MEFDARNMSVADRQGNLRPAYTEREAAALNADKARTEEHSDDHYKPEAGLNSAFREKVDANYASHTLWRDGDVGVPTIICDSNGQVALGLCKFCGKAEAELGDFACTHVSVKKRQVMALWEVRAPLNISPNEFSSLFGALDGSVRVPYSNGTEEFPRHFTVTCKGRNINLHGHVASGWAYKLVAQLRGEQTE